MMGLNFLTIKVHRCTVMVTVVEVDSFIAQGHCPSCQEMLWRTGTGCKKTMFKKQFQAPTEGRSLDSILCPSGYNAYC